MQERFLLPSEFKTAEEYINHLNNFSLKEQLQRVVSLLNIANGIGFTDSTLKVNLKQLEIAKTDCLLALRTIDLLAINKDTTLKNLDETLSKLRKKAHELQERLASIFATKGRKFYKKEDKTTALTYLKHAMELGELSSSYDVAGIELEQKKYPEVTYALKLGLFFSNNKTDEQTIKFRSLAHETLAFIKKPTAPEEIPLTDLRKFLSHLFRSWQYGNEQVLAQIMDYGNSLKPNKDGLSEKEFFSRKKAFLESLNTISHPNGMRKTIFQTNSKQRTKEETQAWLQYHDPRLKPEKYGNHAAAFFQFSPSLQLLLAVGKINQSNQYVNLIKALKEGKYSLALRNASVNVLLPFVTLILKYKTALNININDPSATGNLTALDLVNKATDSKDKTSIINLLRENGAQTKEELEVQAKQTIPTGP